MQVTFMHVKAAWGFGLKPAAYATYFPAGLLAELESCHRIGCDAVSASSRSSNQSVGRYEQ